jgi:glycosyltransferase involved in cell wall biosynthesis
MEKMKGYFLYYNDLNDPNLLMTGIDRKVTTQIQTLNRAGCPCEFMYCPQPETLIGKIASVCPLHSDGVRWPNPREMKGTDYLYIRRPRLASRELLLFLREFRSVNPNALVIYEIPTFPYDGELQTPRLYPLLRKDRKYRKGLRQWVNYAAVLVDVPDAFGMPTVKISNGVDLSAIQPRSPSFDPGGDRIDILCVAFFSPWHGIDRLLAGLHEYYQGVDSPREVHLHLAGGGGETYSQLIRQCDELKLGDYVTFYGPLSPTELEPLYDTCALGVECLGMHRKGEGHNLSASLKSREYLAKGLPFIYANDIDLFLEDPVDFCLRIPDDESPVDISAIIRFHDNLYSHESPGFLTTTIRSYAEKHVGMEKAMANAIDLMKKWCG